MPQFTNEQYDPNPIKMIYLGHTGEGKTGSTVALAAAGYNVRNLDIDNGVSIIRDYLFNPASPYLQPRAPLWDGKPFAHRYSYVTCAEQYNIVGTTAIPKATSWQRINQQLNNWVDGPDKLGNISTWTDRDVLVIEGLSRLCEAAMNFQLSLVGRLDKGPRVGTSGDNDYTQAYTYIRRFLDFLKSPDIKCHIIISCHIKFMVDQAQTNPQSQQAQREMKGFPQTIGRMISPEIGQYFNHALRTKIVGVDPNVKYTIVTKHDDAIGLKNVAPLRVKDSYPLESGLAEYFHAIRGPLT